MSSFVEAIEAGSVVRVNDILSFLAVSSNKVSPTSTRWVIVSSAYELAVNLEVK